MKRTASAQFDVERRLYPRVLEEHRVSIRVVQAPERTDMVDRKYSCTTHDLSAGGLSFVAGKVLSIGSTLEIEVTLRRPLQMFRLRGRVAWTGKLPHGRRYSVGLFLTGPDRQALITWKKALAEKGIVRET
jgi:hypothetical protein